MTAMFTRGATSGDVSVPPKKKAFVNRNMRKTA
jgi:hypothetical protein